MMTEAAVMSLQMDFRGSKVEPRIVKRGRIVLQYLFDQHQKGQGNTLESAVRYICWSTDISQILLAVGNMGSLLHGIARIVAALAHATFMCALTPLACVDDAQARHWKHP